MEIKHYQTLESTNITAAEAARKGCEAFFTVLADTQTAGRGRLAGRRFFSPPDGLYFSTVLRPSLPASEYGQITPFAAVAVHRAVSSVCGIPLQIKWVNDLLYHGKKVCGILAESGQDLQGNRFVILGIGINTGISPFPPELCDIAANIPCRNKEELLMAVLSALQDYETELKQGKWLAEYRTHAAFIGEPVLYTDGQNTKQAFCVGINEKGHLQLLDEKGNISEYAFGEISIRSAQKV